LIFSGFHDCEQQSLLFVLAMTNSMLLEKDT